MLGYAAIAVATALVVVAAGAALGSRTSKRPEKAPPSGYRGPAFEPAAGWTTVTTTAADVAAGWVALAWATNAPLPTKPGPFATFATGGKALRDLADDEVLIVVWLGAPEFVPAPDSSTYPDRRLPLRVADADVRSHWEGQPRPDVPQYFLNARINEQFVDVRVYFGTQDPAPAVLAEADEALARLVVPEPR